MGKSRKTVIVDDDVWWYVKRMAMEQKVTLADYIEGCLRNGPRVVLPLSSSGKLDPRSLSDPEDDSDWKEGTADPYEHSESITASAMIETDHTKIVNDGSEISDKNLQAANERLLKKRTEIKGAIKTASDLPNRYRAPEFSGGVPKAKWK